MGHPEDLADGIGQRSYLAQAGRHFRDAFGSECQPIDCRWVEPHGRLKVKLVRLKEVRLMALESVRHGQQGRILHFGWQQRQLWSCSLRLRGLRDDVISEIHNGLFVFPCHPEPSEGSPFGC